MLVHKVVAGWASMTSLIFLSKAHNILLSDVFFHRSLGDWMPDNWRVTLH